MLKSYVGYVFETKATIFMSRSASRYIYFFYFRSSMSKKKSFFCIQKKFHFYLNVLQFFKNTYVFGCYPLIYLFFSTHSLQLTVFFIYVDNKVALTTIIYLSLLINIHTVRLFLFLLYRFQKDCHPLILINRTDDVH